MKVFVLMSFDTEFDALYELIKRIFSEFDHKVFRADDLLNQQSILKDIVISINDSDLILADLTGLNSNVFYELGLAHALRKNVILLTQDISELPFDLKSYRVIEYSTHFSQIEIFKSKLKRIIADIEKNDLIFSNPVTDWLSIVEEVQIDKHVSSNEILYDSEIEEESEDDLGFLDFMADMEESLEELTNVIFSIAEKTETMGEIATENSKIINNAYKTPSQGTTSYVRKIARKTAKSMDEYGLFIRDNNEKYEKLWSIYENAILRFLETDMPIKTEEDFIAFEKYIENLSEVKNSILGSVDGFASMVESFIGLKGIQKDISRAATLVEIETKRFIGLLDKSVATIDKVEQIAKIRIEEIKS